MLIKFDCTGAVWILVELHAVRVLFKPADKLSSWMQMNFKLQNPEEIKPHKKLLDCIETHIKWVEPEMDVWIVRRVVQSVNISSPHCCKDPQSVLCTNNVIKVFVWREMSSFRILCVSEIVAFCRMSVYVIGSSCRFNMEIIINACGESFLTRELITRSVASVMWELLLHQIEETLWGRAVRVFGTGAERGPVSLGSQWVHRTVTSSGG